MSSPSPSAVPTKRILYCGSDAERFHDLVGRMAASADSSVENVDKGCRFSTPRAEQSWMPVFTIAAAQQFVQHDYVNLVVIDLRSDHGGFKLEQRVERVRRLLVELDDVDDLEARYGFHRIMVLVSGPDGDRIDRLLIELGGFGVRHALKHRRDPSPDGGWAERDPDAFAEKVLDQAEALMLERPRSQTALCAAGGGITAIFFELGALKCLDDCLTPGTHQAFDMYFGISAGAVVTSLLANGFLAEEFMAALSGHEGGRIAPLSLSLARLGHVNWPDMNRRLGIALRSAVRSAIDVVRGRGGPTIDDVFLGGTALVGAPFRSDRYEQMLRGILESPGSTNDFRELRAPLYIGASNQDARRHCLFGDEEHDHVPISVAAQASLSINPAFSAVEIDGAFYEDGAVTRTSNFVEAIRRGADLIFVLDPFVPYVSKEPGFANRRGMLFNIDQDVRSISYTRYENARNWALRRYPEVSSYTFLPNNRLRKLLSINPMDHRIHIEIGKGAYLATLARLQAVRHRLEGDLAAHGLKLDLQAAEAIAERLEAVEEPTLADFFVDGRVELRTPPLTLDHA